MPRGTKTYVLILHDLDTAPHGQSTDFLHWIIFNIPRSVRSLPQNIPHLRRLPDGAEQVRNYHGAYGYMGPAARYVYHHYTFELYALDTKLDLNGDATRARVLAAMNGHIIGKAAYIGMFHR